MMISKYIDGILEREKGYSDHPADKGGPTMHGITEQVARAFGYHGRMQDMPVDVARRIYEERYWLQPGFDKIDEHSPALAEKLLDVGVNMGQATAGKFMQRALNVLNLQGKTYPDITVDGSVGRMSIAALRALLAHRGKDGETVLLQMVRSQQGVRYIEIAENNPDQESFEFGWQLQRAGV